MSNFRMFPVCLGFFLIIPLLSNCQNIEFEWAKSFGSSDIDHGVSLAIDSNKSIIYIGFFRGTVDFDAGDETIEYTSIGAGDIYITKYDSSGKFIWCKTLGGKFDDNPEEIKIDKHGDLVIIGSFQETVDFDPGPNEFSLSTNYVSGFVLKLDSNGNFIWAEQIGVSGDFNNLDIDPENNIIIGGSFMGAKDFDPGPGVFLATAAVLYYADMFILKLSSLGTFVWMSQIKNAGKSDHQEFGLTCDFVGDIYFAGGFTDKIDFDPGVGNYILNSNGNDDCFILKLKKDGQFVWVKQIGGKLSDKVYDLQTDKNGDLFVTGAFQDTVDFDPGPQIYIQKGEFPYHCGFVLKLNRNGDFVFARQFEKGDSFGQSITLDSTNNIYVSGSFQQTVDFDPGIGTHNLSGGSIFIAKLDVSGNFRWVAGYKSTGNFYTIFCTVKVDVLNNVYTTGGFLNSVDFDPNPPIYSLSTRGSSDIYIHKLSQCKSAQENITINTCSEYTLNNITYNSTGTYIQTLSTISGCDSLVILNLIVGPKGSKQNIITCKPFTWNSRLITKSGIYKDTLRSSEGCDSIIELTLTINKIISHTQIATCKPYLWNGKTFSQSGTYIDSFKTSSGCDSLAELILTINNIISHENVTTCKPYLWNGNLLSAKGIYYDTLQTIDGCDSIASITLAFDTLYSKSTVFACEPYLWNGRLLSESGVYKDSFLVYGGCDSIAELDLHINEKPLPQLGKDTVMCPGEVIKLNPGVFASYSWNNNSTSSTLSIKDSGTYWVIVKNNNNCYAVDTIQVSRSLSCLPFAIPNAFTPNRDGKNDYFKPIIQLEISEYDFRIFNRWGQQIFISNQNNNGWDGIYRSVDQPSGIYAYVVKFKLNGISHFYKGTVLLLR